MSCVLNVNGAGTDYMNKIGGNASPTIDLAQTKSSVVSAVKTESSVPPSTPRRQSLSSDSQSSPSSGTTSGSLSSPSYSGNTSDSLALDSQPPNVVTKVGRGERGVE